MNSTGSCLSISQNATAPKLNLHIPGNVGGLITSQNATAPKPSDANYDALVGLITSQNATVPKLSTISNRVGMKKEHAEQAFNHLFIEEHNLEDGRHRFSPDYDMAQSIQRVLGTGEMLEHDKILFPHEYLESKYMNHGFDQRRAHELANLDYNYEDALDQWLESEK